MAFSHGTQARVWLDGHAASCVVNEVSIDAEVDTAETTTLCKTAKTYIPGLEDGTVSLSGFFDTDTADPAGTLESVLHDRARTLFPILYYPQGGDMAGDPAYIMNGFLSSYAIGTSVSEAATVEMEYQTSSGFIRGLVLQPEITVSVSDDGDHYDSLTATTDGGAAILSVSAASGTSPELNVVIEHTADDPSGTPVWSTLATFNTAEGISSEIVPLVGTVQRYLRVVWTVSGASAEFTFNVTIRKQ